MKISDEELQGIFRKVLVEKRSIRAEAIDRGIDPKTLWNWLVKRYGRAAVNRASTKHGRLSLLFEYVKTGDPKQQEAAEKFIIENYERIAAMDVDNPTDCYTLRHCRMLSRSETYLEFDPERVGS